MRRTGLMIVLLTALTAPALAQQAQIEAANAKWTALFDQGDFDGLGRLYTPDAIAFPPGSPMVKGRAAIVAMMKNLAGQAGTPKLTTIDVKRVGPSAIREIGTFSFMTKDASPKEMTGKYLVLWERVGKEWKLAADIWNDGK